MPTLYTASVRPHDGAAPPLALDLGQATLSAIKHAKRDRPHDPFPAIRTALRDDPAVRALYDVDETVDVTSLLEDESFELILDARQEPVRLLRSTSGTIWRASVDESELGRLKGVIADLHDRVAVIAHELFDTAKDADGPSVDVGALKANVETLRAEGEKATQLLLAHLQTHFLPLAMRTLIASAYGIFVPLANQQRRSNDVAHVPLDSSTGVYFPAPPVATGDTAAKPLTDDETRRVLRGLAQWAARSDPPRQLRSEVVNLVASSARHEVKRHGDAAAHQHSVAAVARGLQRVLQTVQLSDGRRALYEAAADLLVVLVHVAVADPSFRDAMSTDEVYRASAGTLDSLIQLEDRFVVTSAGVGLVRKLAEPDVRGRTFLELEELRRLQDRIEAGLADQLKRMRKSRPAVRFNVRRLASTLRAVSASRDGEGRDAHPIDGVEELPQWADLLEQWTAGLEVKGGVTDACPRPSAVAVPIAHLAEEVGPTSIAPIVPALPGEKGARKRAARAKALSKHDASSSIESPPSAQPNVSAPRLPTETPKASSTAVDSERRKGKSSSSSSKSSRSSASISSRAGHENGDGEISLLEQTERWAKMAKSEVPEVAEAGRKGLRRLIIAKLEG